MKKRDVITRMAMVMVAYSVGFTISNAMINTSTTSTKTVVAEMYTFKCEDCGYDKAEGDYSYVSEQGFERCPECGMYREITSPRD